MYSNKSKTTLGYFVRIQAVFMACFYKLIPEWCGSENLILALNHLQFKELKVNFIYLEYYE